MQYVAVQHFHTSDQKFCICYISDVALLDVLQLSNCWTTSQLYNNFSIESGSAFPLECS